MLFKANQLFAWSYLAAQAFAVDPAAVYDGNGAAKDANISVKIGNGGAGQSGLVEALANAFIKQSIDNGTEPFRVAWYKSDTTQTINYLKAQVVDIGITYTIAAEEVAVEAKIVEAPIYYLFRDHFLVVGPPSNPANLSDSDDTKSIFSKIYAAAEAGNTDPPVRFLSRFDKSATNIKDSLLWIDIGQTPWANPGSTWYHEYIAYPIQALTAAAYLEEYTITDRGTMLSLDKDIQNLTEVFKAAEDNEDDPLLNPAHLLIGKHAPEFAETFAKWALSDNGQKVITDFEKFGAKLYTGAPANKTIDARVPAKPAKESQPQVQVVIGYGKEEWTTVVHTGL